MEGDVVVRQGYVSGMIGDITRLHAEYYGREWGFGMGFEAQVARDVGAFLERYEAERDGIWTVWEAGRAVAAILIDGYGTAPDEARLRYFIVGDAARGHGLGRHLMETALAFCDAKAYGRVTLKTLDGLKAACHLYEAFGFVVYERAWHEGIQELFYERLRPQVSLR